MDFVDYGREVLSKNGYRLTSSRVFVLSMLADSHCSLNAYSIAEAAELVGVKIDVSTVYRILEVFRGLNLVHFVALENGFVACKNCNFGHKHCHHQFVCSECKTALELDFEDKNFLNDIQKRYPDLKFKEHNFEFLGLCSNCK